MAGPLRGGGEVKAPSHLAKKIIKGKNGRKYEPLRSLGGG